MSMLRTACVVGALGLLAGCSQSPYPMPREIGDVSQETLSGGVHWQILAAQSATKVLGCLEGLTFWNPETKTHEPYCRQDVDSIRYTPIYVEATDSGVPFGEAFHRYLSTEIVERGLELSQTPGGSLVLATRFQVLNRPMPVPINSWPGFYTLLGGGVAALGAHWATLAATGLAADAYVSAADYGGAQVIVTTMLLDGSRTVMSKSDAYFIEDADLAQYARLAPAPDATRPMKAGAGAPDVRSFAVVSE